MIVGLGVDVLETDRIERALGRHGTRFEARVFTETERAECNGRSDRMLAFAARFAAKEACLKALGLGLSTGFVFKDVEVVRMKGGAPSLQLHRKAASRARDLGVRNLHVSLTHQPKLAAAVVVLEGSS